MIALLADHLWQSTLFALGAGLLTLLLRRNSAGARYGLWFAASVKFLIPFALLTAAGGALASRLHLALVPPQAVEAAAPSGPLQWAPQMMAPATAFEAHPTAVPVAHALAVPFDPAPHALAARVDLAPILLGAWVLGLAAILLIWAARWSRIRAALRNASPVRLSVPVPALSSRARMEPGVVGLWRPVLVLPEGIAERLSPAELEAVITHEMCHLRRRDNLTGAIHMLVQSLFWFHPLVWWLGARLVAERERACDEAVVRAGHDRETYARGLIETCRLYLHAPLACVSGASGSNLEQRVDEIMSRPLSVPLALEARASFGMAGMLALTIPVAAGLLTAPPVTQPLAALVRAARMAALPEPRETRSVPRAAQASPRALTPVAQPGPAASAIPAEPVVPAPPQAVVADAPDAPPGAVQGPTEPPKVQLKSVSAEPVETAAAAPGPAASPAATETATPAEIRRQAYTFAQTFGATTVRLDQLARWTQPICVTVQGAPADAAAIVMGRVQGMANDLGVGTAQSGCKANVQVIFTDKPQALLERVAVTDERMLGYWHHRQRDKLKAVTHPIQAWYMTATGGGGAVGKSALGTAWQPRGFQIDDEESLGWGPTGCGDSPHFTACLTSEFQSVLVVVDTGRVQDVAPGLVADYVTMLALAQPRSLDSCNLPSVIEAFAKDCPARAGANGLTRADVAYLDALYRIDLQSKKAVQQTDIAARMADLLIKGAANDRVAALGGGGRTSAQR